MPIRDNSLLEEFTGWIQESLQNNNWQLVDVSSFNDTVSRLNGIYGQLPKQLIHRDVHFGNFLFDEPHFSGYIDFDLSQRNIRIFDICYFLLGLLAEDKDVPLSTEEWLSIFSEVLAGYKSQIPLTDIEKLSIPYVMESIELLFTTYFLNLGKMPEAEEAARLFFYIRGLEPRIVCSA